MDELSEPEKQLHRRVLYHTQPGDIFVVDARGDMKSGIFGEVMLAYFKGRGGEGVVNDCCTRDYTNAKSLGLGLCIRGLTPNFHTQTDLMLFAVNCPVACGGVVVMPGDVVVAHDDGPVVIPVVTAERVIEEFGKHHDWEDFSRERLAAGGDPRRYYPLQPDAEAEYEAWKVQHKRIE